MLRIPLVVLPKFRKYLYIENRFETEETIVPIGCDCHPAFTMKKLHIREDSLPFDWLNTDPVLGIKYVEDNILNNFSNYLSGLYRNDNGHIVSKAYGFVEFIHEKDLIENIDSQTKLRRRVDRFLEIFKSKDCSFLYNIKSESLKSDDDVKKFVSSVRKFLQLIKEKDKLHIYIRYDEDFTENKQYCENLFFELKNIEKVQVVKYIRKLKKYGMWGKVSKYPKLYKKLDLKIKWVSLKIYTKNVHIK